MQEIRATACWAAVSPGHLDGSAQSAEAQLFAHNWFLPLNACVRKDAGKGFSLRVFLLALSTVMRSEDLPR